MRNYGSMANKCLPHEQAVVEGMFREYCYLLENNQELTKNVMTEIAWANPQLPYIFVLTYTVLRVRAILNQEGSQ